MSAIENTDWAAERIVELTQRIEERQTLIAEREDMIERFQSFQRHRTWLEQLLAADRAINLEDQRNLDWLKESQENQAAWNAYMRGFTGDLRSGKDIDKCGGPRPGPAKQ